MSSVGATFRELVIRQACSAFASNLCARASSAPGEMVRVARTVKAVNWVPLSVRSSVPSTCHSSAVHSNFEALAMARKDNAKQSATAATSKVSGDHWSPGPPNSAGAAEANGCSPLLDSLTLSSGLIDAVTP